MTKITIDRAVVEQALEALELLQNAIYNIGGEHVTGWGYANDAADSAEKPITTLKAALVEPQEPGFWGRVAARQASRIKQLETTGQQTLEALENFGMKHYENTGEVLHRDVYEALKAALAEPQNPCNPSCAPGYCYCEPVHGVKE
jgi:hypothetical protein